MVRVNLINPASLADQHLVAEYDEILMLLGYVKRYPKVKPGEVPEHYKLGSGHIRFFKDKIRYLYKRHELLKIEMRRRGFKPTKKIVLTNFPKSLLNDWKPTEADFKIIRQRISEKILNKPNFYRYAGKHMPKEFFLMLLKKG